MPTSIPTSPLPFGNGSISDTSTVRTAKYFPLGACSIVAFKILNGTSIVTESIFDNRFKYVDELAKMGSNIKVEGNTAIIEGVDKLTSADLTAPDLRAGAALVLACLTAEGFSTVDDIKYIERGYEDFDVKLRGLGAHIEKVESERELMKFKLKIG